MKPKNNSTVRKAYIKFSYFLAICIVWAVVVFSCFLKTASVEVKEILQKTIEYDRIYAKQIELANSVDSIYQYMKLMNTDPKINDILLQSLVSTRKMNILKFTREFDSKDCQLYSRLLNNVNLFLSVKDSIRLLSIKEELVREDLNRCIQDNRKTKRKLSIGNVSIEK